MATVAPPAVSISNLVVRYGTYVAVESLDLEVPRGAFFGLLGPNGAGKSSTISCVAGLIEPASGQLSVLGHDVRTQRRQAIAALGVVPQSLALFPDLSVGENLRIFGGVQGLSGARLRARVQWALALSQLEDRHTTRVKALSGGMARRLNLAAALLHDPPVIICDEPTTGVDPQSRQHLFDTLRQLHAEGRTIIYTTHYLEEVEALCADVAILDRGRCIARGTLDSLLSRPGAERGFDVAVPSSVSPEAVVHALDAAGIGGARVEPRRRSLEALFLELTGRALRDDDGAVLGAPAEKAS